MYICGPSLDAKLNYMLLLINMLKKHVSCLTEMYI